MKIIFTCIKLNSGGSGGVLTPIFFIGATSGLLFAGIFGLDHTLFSSIGFVALLAGAANTPIAAMIMVYAGTACVISFLITGHRSIFPSQIMKIQKSTSIVFSANTEVEDMKIYVTKRKKSVLGMFEKFVKLLRKKL